MKGQDSIIIYIYFYSAQEIQYFQKEETKKFMEDSSQNERPELKTEVSLTQIHERKKQSEDSSNNRNIQTLTRALLVGVLDDKSSTLLAWCQHGDNKTTVADFEAMERYI